MRVLVVTTWYPTSSAPGAGVFVARDAAAIATRHDVRVLHLVAPRLLGEGDAEGSVADGDVQVERLPMDPRRPDQVLRAARRIRELAAHADVVHTMAVSALLPMTGWRPRVPWVHTEHWSGIIAPDSLGPLPRLARPAMVRALGRPDVVAVVSTSMAQTMRGLRNGPVVVVPNIVETPTMLTPRREPGLPLRERDVLDLIGVGGLLDGKDPLTAVETVAELRRRGIAATLRWVGDGPLRAEVGARAEALGVPLHLAGAVAPEAVRSALGSSDLFLLPTRAETFCLAAAEALAAGRPVVVGDAGGPSDFVEPPSGRLVTPGAPAPAWADAVEQVWKESAELSAEQISAPIAAGFGAERHAELVDEVYRGLVRPPHASSPHTLSPHLSAPGRSAPPAGAPLVDVVIATHTPERAIERAVRSVLDGSADLPVRVSVVCHNVNQEQIEQVLSPRTRQHPRVRLLEHRDDLPSPAGPFTHGLEAATAPWVSIMGSDDRLSPGAIGHWLEVADRERAEVVLAQVSLDGATVPTPPVRVSRRAAPVIRRATTVVRRAATLDLVKDRLAYRSAPLGLLSRAAIERTGARLLPGAQTGEDVPFTLRLLEGARVATADHAPYLIGTDAGDRTTYADRPVRDGLVAVTALLDDPWFAGLTDRERTAIATKLLRIHVFGVVLTRPEPAAWTDSERADLAAITRRLLQAAPEAARPLSLADHDLLAAVLDPTVPAEELVARAHARRRFGTPRTLLPHDWRAVLHPEAPLRFMAASLVARRGRATPDLS